MTRTLMIGILLLFSLSYCGCVGYNGCGPCGYNGYNGYNGMYMQQPGGMCVDSCDPCGNTANCGDCGNCESCVAVPSFGMNYACGPNYGYAPYGGGCLRNVGCGAVHAAATPVSWVVQILRGVNYPCGGCGDEVYWADYGSVPHDSCSPCTYEGQWAGSVGGRGACECSVCQSGTAYRYPTVGSSMNQAYAPIFQDKISSTHAKTPLNYGLRGPGFDSCGTSCFDSSCDTGCNTGCDTGYSGGTVSYGSGSHNGSSCCGNGNTIENDVQYEEETQPAPASAPIARRVPPKRITQTHYRR